MNIPGNLSTTYNVSTTPTLLTTVASNFSVFATNYTVTNASTRPPYPAEFQNVCPNYTKKTGLIAYSIFFATVIIVSVIGNALVCLAVALSPKLRETPSNYFLASLAISDIMFSIFILSIRCDVILRENYFCFNIHVCEMFLIMDLISTPASISHLFVIAVDRYLCITSPFKYQIIMSKKRAFYVIGLIWIYAAVWAGLGTFTWDEHRDMSMLIAKAPQERQCMNRNPKFYVTAYFVLYLIPLMLMAFTYLKILHVALAQIKAIKATEVSIKTSSVQPEDETKSQKPAGHRHMRRELKATRTVTMVYGAFVVCWLPSCLINIIIGLDEKEFKKLDTLRVTNESLFFFIYYTFLEILPALSSAVNPLIYSASSNQFREAFKVVMFRLVGKTHRLWTGSTEFEIEASRKTSMSSY